MNWTTGKFSDDSPEWLADVPQPIIAVLKAGMYMSVEGGHPGAGFDRMYAFTSDGDMLSMPERITADMDLCEHQQDIRDSLPTNTDIVGIMHFAKGRESDPETAGDMQAAFRSGVDPEQVADMYDFAAGALIVAWTRNERYVYFVTTDGAVNVQDRNDEGTTTFGDLYEGFAPIGPKHQA